MMIESAREHCTQNILEESVQWDKAQHLEQLVASTCKNTHQKEAKKNLPKRK